MSERSPEYDQIDRIIVAAVAAGWLDIDDDTLETDTQFTKALAAPLEAANARVRELEEAVRLLAKNLAEYTMHRGAYGQRVNCASDEVNANPTARAAIEAARSNP